MGEEGEGTRRITRKQFCGCPGRPADSRQEVRGVVALTAMLLCTVISGPVTDISCHNAKINVGVLPVVIPDLTLWVQLCKKIHTQYVGHKI